MFTNEKQKKDLKDDAGKKDMSGNASPPNSTGIPADMKGRFENISGFSFDDVRVHYNSGKPAQLQALAYTQGNQVYVGPTQEKHLGHELGHVVQQKEGRVQPTMRLRGINANDDEVLEREADMISSNAINYNNYDYPVQRQVGLPLNNSVQFKMYTISKSLPLKQTEKVQTTDYAKDGRTVEKSSGQKAYGIHLEALRVKYPPIYSQSPSPDSPPVPPPVIHPTKAHLAKYDPWRGDEFFLKKEQLGNSLKTAEGRFITDPIPVTAATVGNGRSGNRRGDLAEPIKKLMRDDKMRDDNWIGAHLIKDSWGGADNMMNVVAWREAAEAKWATGFENHIDSAFTLTPETSANIKVEATKEDEYISRGITPYDRSLRDLDEVARRGDLGGKKAWLEQEIERARWSVNAAIETVPLAASAMYWIYEHGAFSKAGVTVLKSDETGYNDAIRSAQGVFDKIAGEKQASIGKIAAAEERKKENMEKQRKTPTGKPSGSGGPPPFVSVFDAANGLNIDGGGVEAVADIEREKRSTRRKNAIWEEVENLRPDNFYIDIERYTAEDIERLVTLGYDVTVEQDEEQW